jgi:maltose phosphorylase
LFDLDGVITDTAHNHFTSWKSAVKHLGIELSENFNESLKGKSRSDSLSAILKNYNKKLSKSQFQLIMKQKNDLYVKSLSKLNSSNILPGMLEVFKYIKKKGWKIAVASASLNAPKIIESLRLGSYIDAIADPKKVKNGKPAPDIFLLAAKMLKAKPEQCICFEDSQAGIESINSAKMFSVAIGDPLIFENQKPSIIFKNTGVVDMQQILDKFEGKKTSKTTNEGHFKRLFEIDEWTVTQNKLHKGTHEFRISESITSLGNEYMGTRGNHEEKYSGDSHQGSYVGGVWFPDKTRVGWWKNGYPKYFGKQINSTNWLVIRVIVNGEELDLNVQHPISYTKSLNMKQAVLYREFTCIVKGIKISVKVERFISASVKELANISYSITADKECSLKVVSVLDGTVKNLDSNHGETFWQPIESNNNQENSFLWLKTKPNNFGVEQFDLLVAQDFSTHYKLSKSFINTEFSSEITYEGLLKSNEKVTFTKTVVSLNTRNLKTSEFKKLKDELLNKHSRLGYETNKENHIKKWEKRWKTSDVIIEGSIESQQAIRFNLMQLYSTFYGEDTTLNIGPKGFTGEKYGGATYWDTEAYCVPVYLGSSKSNVTRALLDYRHKQLPQAIHNAKQQGLKGALYPMVTFNGIECHNEWEITFEEIHRNGAMVHAIWNYVQYTGDFQYIIEKGIDVILNVAIFWADRVHFSKEQQKYMIHGVTGPNEFENNINNNFYTNYLARWCLQYAIDCLNKMDIKQSLMKKWSIESKDVNRWQDIVNKMYIPTSSKNKIYIQHDTFLDKDIYPVSQLPKEQRPIVHHWSWDKILRSCFIKQADTLQTFYFFPHMFSLKEKKNNFDFYEPLTVHESSLSPSIHSVIASEVGYEQKAVEMYLRSARLDLDNVNDDTKDGLHITSTTGSWIAIVQGFAGMRHLEGNLEFNPFLPKQWKSYSFNLNYRDSILNICVKSKEFIVTLVEGGAATFYYKKQEYKLKDSKSISIKLL